MKHVLNIRDREDLKAEQYSLEFLSTNRLVFQTHVILLKQAAVAVLSCVN